MPTGYPAPRVVNRARETSLEKGGLSGEPSLTARRPFPFWSKAHMQGGPASVVKVLLSENQPFTAIEGAPKNHEKNTNSCKWYS